jgi:uroporphyrinogen-III decarboxylase
MTFLDFLPLHVNAGMSFSAKFYHESIKTKMNKVTMEDPIARVEMQKKQGIFVREKFPKYFHNQDPKEYKVNPSLGIGVCTFPKIWGCEIKYKDDMDPLALPLLKPNENPKSLKVPELYDNMQWLLNEIDILTDYGFDKKKIGMPNIQSPLNIATRLVGGSRLLGLIARRNKEDEVKHIMELSSDLFIDAVRELRKNLGLPLKKGWTIAGCTYHYLSPKLWTKYILPIVYKCEVLGPIYFHHCGVMDAKKIEAFSAYPWTGVEMGFGSDYIAARKAFNQVDKKNRIIGPLSFQCRVSPFRILNQTPEVIKNDVVTILDGVKGGPASVSCVGIPFNTPEENIDAYYNTIQEYNRKKEEEEE